MKVVISEFMDEAALQGFGTDYRVLYQPDLVDNRPALLAQLKTAKAIIVRNRTQVDPELLDAAPNLRVVGRLGVGLDNIDMAACAEREISVCPAVGANTLSVVEYVLGTGLALSRMSFWSNAQMIAGKWPRGPLGQGREVSEKTLGLLGFGAIAQAVAEKARALGMKIAAYDPFLSADDPAWNGVQFCDLQSLLSISDILSLHVPLTPHTENLIDADAFEQMRPGAILINTARGGIVDENALIAALKIRHLGGAALDVFETEPLTAQAGERFREVPNLILTPHIAGVTSEGNTRVSFVTVENVCKVLQGET